MSGCKVPGCEFGTWKHGLCRDHWMANARGENIGLPQPALPVWARPQTTTVGAAPPPIRTTVTAPPAPRSTVVSHPLPAVPTKASAPLVRERRPLPERPPKPAPVLCSVAGCTRWARTNGMCHPHAKQTHPVTASSTPAPPPPEPPAEVLEQPTTHAPVLPSRLEAAALRLVWAQVPIEGRRLNVIAHGAGLTPAV
ncbi:MAG: hypothetical protein IT190_08425, partial [Microbacteriaceae bacterium]|nr:hypothetical protein [Microbacteriaceae bacterium]